MTTFGGLCHSSECRDTSLSHMATLQFLGATGTVTGSKYVLEAAGERLMIDCGLFQGEKELRLRNWSPLPVPPRAFSGWS